MKLGNGVFKQSERKPVRLFKVGGNSFTHKANWEHIGKILAEKQRRLKIPLVDV